jgi:hypothetical protein
LLLQSALIGDIPSRRDCSGDAPFLVMHGARRGAKQPPRAILMHDGVFNHSVRAATGHQFFEHKSQGPTVLRVGSAAEPVPNQFLRLIAQNVFDLRTGKCIAGVSIQGDNQIGEAVDQAPGKFLFAVQALLHPTLLRDVHKCALIAHKIPGGIPNDRRSMQDD